MYGEKNVKEKMKKFRFRIDAFFPFFLSLLKKIK